MNLLEKIIYVADYMEPNRDFPGVENLRRLAFTDMDAALKLGLEMTLRHLNNQGAEVSPASREALAFLDNEPMREKVLQELAINAHYDGYLERESDSIKRLQKLELWKIPADFDYNTITGLRNESRAKLTKAAPSTLAQAARLDGVTPSEIGLLQVHLTRLKHQHKESQAE